jgi:hypothetical protein
MSNKKPKPRTRTRRPTPPDVVEFPNTEIPLEILINNALVVLSQNMPASCDDGFEQDMNNIADEFQVRDNTMSNEWEDHISQKHSDRKLNLFKLSFVYCILAKRAYDKSEGDKAISLFAISQQFAHQCNDIENAEFEKQRVEKHRQASSKGGLNRLKTAKEKVIELLTNKYSEGGLQEDVSLAIEAIIDDLSTFIENNSIKLIRDPELQELGELYRTLTRWIKTDPEVSAKFNELRQIAMEIQNHK